MFDTSPPPIEAVSLMWDHEEQKWFIPDGPDIHHMTVPQAFALLRARRLLDWDQLSPEQLAAYHRATGSED